MAELITTTELVAKTVTSVELDPLKFQLTDIEVLSGLVRHSASYATPCPPSTLKRLVLTGLRGLANSDEISDLIDTVIDGLVGYGDLIELRSAEPGDSRLYLYSGFPSFVEPAPGHFLILGIRDAAQQILPDTLMSRINCVGFTRRILAEISEDLSGHLRQLGLHHLPEVLWQKEPTQISASELKRHFDIQLNGTNASSSVEGLIVVDPERSPRYYKARWVQPKGLTGRFVGRREQYYGAPLWCYVELKNGQPTKLLDLLDKDWRGCDLAWRLLLALDYMNGRAQTYRTELLENGEVLLRLYSPIPSWVQRRWDLLGSRVTAPHCLLAYRLSYDQYVADLPRLRDSLWLAEQTTQVAHND
jgi:hypothetical protein